MKFIASVVLFAAIQLISSKFYRERGCGPQTNLACVDQAALANSNSFALNAGIGNANANSVSVANNNNEINQINKCDDCCKKDKCCPKKDKCEWKCDGCKWRRY